MVQTPNIVICIPSLSGSISGWTAASIANLSPGPDYLRNLHETAARGEGDRLRELAFRALPFTVADTWIWPCNIVTTRSRAVKRFLFETAGTHLLFVDADVTFTLDALRGMLALGKDFIAAPYPKRDLRWGAIVEAVNEGRDPALASNEYVYRVSKPRTYQPGAACVEVDGTGMGFTLLSRELLQSMWNAYGNPLLNPDGENLSDVDSHPLMVGPTVQLFALQWGDLNGQNHLFGEDHSFCNRARHFAKIWLYTGAGSPLSHVGEMLYQGTSDGLHEFMQSTLPDDGSEDVDLTEDP